MALPALLGAGARAIGGSMVKAGGRAAAAKILGRNKNAQPGRPGPRQGGESGGGRGGALVVRPKTKFVSGKEIKELQTGSPVSPGNDPLKSIYSNVIIIEKILKATLAAEKDQLNQKKKDDKKGDREKQEQKLETKTKNPEKKKLEMPKTPGMGIFGWIKNFIGNVILGYFAVRLIKYLPQLMEIAKVMMRVVEFVADVGIKLIDGLATFINWGYKAYDATKGFLKNIGGEKLAGAFDGLMKVVDTAVTVLAFALGAQSLGGFGGGGGRGGGGRTGIGGRGAGRTPTTSSQAARRYAQRFGRDAATRRFGEQGVRSLGGKYARSGATNLARKAAVGVLGRGGTRAALRVVKPLVRRIPIIGGVMEFVLSMMAGEPVGKAAFRAVGSGLGTWIGGALGSLIPIPFVGTAIGAFIGGAGGAELAGAMYDAFFGGKTEVKNKNKNKKAYNQGGKVSRGFSKGTLERKKKTKRKKPSYEKIKPPEGGQIKTGEKTEQAWWDFMGWAGTGGQDEVIKLDAGGQLLAKRVVDVGNQFGGEEYFGPMLSLVSKFILGQKPTERDYKNIGYGINMLIGDGVDAGKIAEGVKGYAEGGKVQAAMTGVDVSRWVTDTFRKDMATAINKNYEMNIKQPVSTSEPPPGGGSGAPVGSGGGSTNLTGSNVEKWKAIYAMAQKAGAKYPELVAAQFALESAWGTALAADNNFFGIKATGSEDATVSNTREVVNGQSVYVDARFKNFATPQDAINHLVNQWYKDYKGYRGVNNASDAFAAALMLKSEGYATDPVYAQSLQRLMNEYANVRGREEDIASFVKPGTVPTSLLSSNAGADIKVGGSNIVNIGKDLASKGFAVAEHPDFTKNTSGGKYTPGKGFVSSVHKGRGHYEGRALDVTDHRGSMEDSKARYRSVLTSLQNNPAIKMLIHDSWGGMYGGPGTKQGPGGHGHPTHMHIEVKDRGGFIGKGLFANLGGTEFVTDADSTAALKQEAPGLMMALNQAKNRAGVAKVLQQYASYEQGAPQTVIIDDSPKPQESSDYSQGSGSEFMPMIEETESPFDFLDYQG